MVYGLPARMSGTTEPASMESERSSLAGVDSVVAVASTKGGVGKSTVATRLACALAGDRDVGIFDADIFGPNVPSILGVDGNVTADDRDRPIPVETDGVEVMSVGFLTDDGPLAWRGAMAHEALSGLFEDTMWQNTDTVVLDLPPGTSDVVLTALQEIRIDGVVFVTTPFHTSLADTKRSRELFAEHGVPTLGTVVNMDGFVCEECGHDHDLFERAGSEDPDPDSNLDTDGPVLARIPFMPDLQGRPSPGDADYLFDKLATDVLDAVEHSADRIDLPDDPVDIRDLPATGRYDAVSEAFTVLDPGETFYLVSDRDPTPAGKFLVELLGVRGSPTEVFEEFVVEQRGPEEWALKAVLPETEDHEHGR